MEDQFLKLVFDNAHDGIIVINRKGKIERINPAVTRIFQYSSKELLGENISKLMPSPDKDQHDEYLSNYLRTGVKKIIDIGREVEGMKKDGSIFPLFLSVSEFSVNEERKFLGIVHNLTDLRKREEDLHLSRRQLEALFDNAVEGIVIINERGTIIRVNESMEKLFQYAPIELLDQNVRILMPEPHRTKHDTYIHNYKSTRIPKIIGIGREVEGRKKDGTLFPINLSITEVVLNDESIFAGFIHDLSELKNNERKIRRLNAELELKVEERTEELSSVVSKLLTANKNLEKEVQNRIKVENALRETEKEVRQALTKEKELSDLKSRFVSMASHEFRTPLSTIRSSAEIIKLYDKEGQQFNREKHINRIKSSVNNLTSILDDFLSLSKLEENKIDLNFSDFDLDEFCNEVKDEMKSLLKRDQKILFNENEKVGVIHSDKRLIKNIMYNLLSNAIKYSAEGTEIHCNRWCENNDLILEVRDRGIGIPEHEQNHLFDRFFRAENATNIQGTGLGLNIVKSYLDLLAGSITFESKEGLGTTFKVVIPNVKTQE